MSSNEELAITSPVTDKQLINDNLNSSSVRIKHRNKKYENQSEDQSDSEDGPRVPLSVFNTLIDSVIKLDPDVEVESYVPKGSKEQAVQELTNDRLLDFHPNIDYDQMIKSGEIPVCPDIEDRPELERPVACNTFRSESLCSEGPSLNVKGKKSHYRLNSDVNDEFSAEKSVNKSIVKDENFNPEEKDDSELKTSPASQSESDLSEKNDYSNMIYQEIYSIVNAISPENLQAIETSDGNITRLEPDIKIKPMVIEDSDAHCMYSWSLLSPGTMEIKINPESDNSNDVICIRRTSSLQCHIVSGDITKLNVLRENENDESDNGDMDYVNFIEYLAQASNQGHIQQIQEEKSIIKEQETKNILQETTQKDNQIAQNEENVLLTEVISIKEKMSVEDIKCVQMIPPDVEETLTLPEEEIVGIEKSLVSVKVVESVEQIAEKMHSIDTHKSKKNGKKIFPPLKNWFKSKKSNSSHDDSSKKQNERQKSKSWFRFWF